ncbi:hypothetical protein ACQKTA_13190 (plasmid) [Enterococcus sp. 22-H-5-01]|uniref:hypothetical protein n=1 Tax=Enterococcus sp. 22-H-5-01 TaxID=3418555 RepID=UPI003D0077ED
MYLISLTVFLIGIAGIIYFNKKNDKYYKISVLASLVAFSLFCAFAPFALLQDKMTIIDSSEVQIQQPHSTQTSDIMNMDYIANNND